MTTLTFLGAVDTVTGSRYLIESPDARVLVDCGLFQGTKNLRSRNWVPLPTEMAALDAFSGDVGRPADPIGAPPEPLGPADYLEIESTYGDRRHPDEELTDALAQVVVDTIEKHGTLVVPAFAVGRALLGQYVPVRAKIVRLDGLSAHADYAELITWLRTGKLAPCGVFVPHGEPSASDAFRRRLRDAFGWDARVPKVGETVTLEPR